MKKIFAVLLMALMMLSIVACTTEPADTDADATTAAPTTTVQSTVGTTTKTTTTAATTVATTTAAPQTPVTEKTEWKPQIYTTTTTAPSYPALKPAEAVNKKTVGDNMTSSITKKKYELKWIEEFNGSELDLANWRYALGNAGAGEKQANIRENLEIKDGKAIFHAKKDTKLHKDSFGRETYYTGTKIDSISKVYYKYGRFEAYIKLPYGKGMWPAFWTMGTEDGWPWGGEIDILEMSGVDFTYTSTIHWIAPGTSADAAYAAHPSAGIGIFGLPNFREEKLNDKFHVIGMEWTPTKIYMYCDGNMFGSVSITGTDMRVAFHQPHYILLNFALGGMGGTIDDKALPQKMEVDWVKVWQTV
ncbi:MAG: glycoside hydrolase family 16 protein [Clostridia bacterium]|nr:glycoside hydrolase family 16 protein [Clostridia bacterium]